MRNGLVLLLCLLSSASLGAADQQAPPAQPALQPEQVYEQVYDQLSAPDQRLPGSAGYLASLDAVEHALTGAGLTVHRQSYPTLVPETTLLRLSIDGGAVAGVHALAPNGVGLPTTWGKALSGPLLYLGGGSLEEMDGKSVQGCIAAIDFDSRNLGLVFSQGARAVILVGKDGVTQWQAAACFTTLPMSLPLLWIGRQDAEAAGIIAADGRSQASVEIASRWKQVQGINLWARIPATAPLPLEAGQHPGAVVLSATLDTFGAVPDLCPQLRGAANCALLSEVAAGLSAGALRRTVYVVFLGSHFAAQDGARSFYYPVGKVMGAATGSNALDAREKDLCQGGLARCLAQKAMIADDSFLTKSSDEALEVYEIAHNHVVGREADDSYDINQLIQHRQEVGDAIKELGTSPDHDAAAALDQRLAALRDQEEALRKDKKSFNVLRSQIGRKVVVDPASFVALRSWLSGQIDARQELFTRLLADTRSAEDIASAMGGVGPGSEAVVAHFDFNFANDAGRWTLTSSGTDAWARAGGQGVGAFGKQLKAYAAVIHRKDGPQPWFPDESINFDYDALSMPETRCLPIAAAIGRGVPAFELVTIGEPLDLDEMPVRAPCRLQALGPVLADDLRAIAASGDLPPESGVNPVTPSDRLVIRASGSAVAGLQAMDLARGSDLVECPARNALVMVSTLAGGPTPIEPPYGLGGIDIAIGQIDASGHCYLPGIIDLAANGTKSACQLFGFNQDGAIERFTINHGAVNDLALLTYGGGGGMFTTFRPADYLTGSVPSVLIAGRDSAPHHLYSACFAQAEVFYMDSSQPFKAIGDGLDLLGITRTKHLGAGMPLDPDEMLRLDLNRQSGVDLTKLNLERLKVLRDRNIINKPLEKLQADDQESLDSSEHEAQELKVGISSAHAVISNILSHQIHGPLLDNASDLVEAVVWLLALSLPFSFAMERLLFGATTIYKQIGGFMLLFLLTFAILYVTHPAFSLAEAPVIIFLAFVIIVLSGFTTIIMMGKFKYELKALQGLSSKAHGDQAEGGTAFAAIAIGISGMRNRPLKTFLTATTVALLTFTILVFASFSSTTAVVATPLGTSHGAHRIEFHQPSFLDMPQRLLSTLSTLYGKRYEVIVRGASFRDPIGMSNGSNIALNPADLSNQPLQAVLVVDPREVAHLDSAMFTPLASAQDAAGTASAGAPPAQLPPLLLSQTVAAKLGVPVGGEVRIRGQRFRLAGIFGWQELKRLENIDGTRIVPPDFTATFQANGSHMTGSGGVNDLFKTLDVNNFVFCQPDLVAITTPAGMSNLGYQNNFITMYPREGADADVDADAHDIAEWMDGPVSVSSDRGTTRYFFTDEVEGSGFAEVLVPLLLGGLIIFSSLLGSIVDRQKEIFTYSALGLSPPDVAALFFAESGVFAVIGGMGGYLISQLVIKVLTILASFGLASVPNVNFSSMWSIMVIGVVMATVMLSTIYPALMAGRSANPGVARKWRMPRPEGNAMRFPFPFTVSADSINGILAFIREHFQNHGDASLGSFAARDVQLISRPGEGGRVERGISAEIALAPFDLGVFQTFTMLTRPSDIPGIDEVVVELVRLNGAPTTWIRSNRAFIDDLREQFLRWRSLSIDTVEHYHRLAEQHQHQHQHQHQQGLGGAHV